MVSALDFHRTKSERKRRINSAHNPIMAIAAFILSVANLVLLRVMVVVLTPKQKKASTYRILKNRDHRQTSPAYVTKTSLGQRKAASGPRSIIYHAIEECASHELKETDAWDVTKRQSHIFQADDDEEVITFQGKIYITPRKVKKDGNDEVLIPVSQIPQAKKETRQEL